ncbi:MAG: multidrug efflux RND transporter permease subunit [Bacteroidales bacterium]|nr:multidrug efflux RND transporter permease subunit [Bacteroidales bacterium]
MFSKFFIDRPIFSIVIALLMILAGLLTVETLPVAQYPNISPPTVMVSASYPGADAQTVATTVGVPIEQQVNGVEGMMYMSSTSGSDGSYQLTITFENNVDQDMAAVKVQNRVALAEPTLPSSVQEQGVDVMSRSSNMCLFIALEADSSYNYDALYLTNYAQLNLTDAISRVDGVGQAEAFGSGDYSMRVWLDPDKMRVRELSPSDVVAAIESQNMQVSAGQVGNPPQNTYEAFEFTLTTQGRLITAEEFGNIILRTNSDGSMLRLKDVARVELGSTEYTNVARVDGKQAALIGVSQLPKANTLDVSKKVRAKLDELQPYFPEGVHYKVIQDSSDFVTASIDEVLVTFVETTLIVMVIILIFLQNWRATIIPMITIPVSLIATFAAMKIMGFTLNTLTLFGLVLAIAIVVDDAIVVVEDVARLLSEGKLTPRQASEKAMVELQGAIVGEVLVLISVFVPTAFVSGITGELYKQFALTIAVSTAFSGINALTLTPALCALFLKPKNPNRKEFFIYRWFNKGYGATLNVYMKIVKTFLKRPVVAIIAYFLITGVAFYGFLKMPSSYIPEEDMGYWMGSVQLPTGASLERTDAVMSRLNEHVMHQPGVAHTIAMTGMSFMGGGNGSNLGSLVVTMEPWKDRKAKDESVNASIEEFEEFAAGVQEAICFGLNPPAVPGLGLTSGLSLELLDINNYGSEAMAAAIQKIQDAAAKDSRLGQVTSLYQGGVPQYRLNFNRDKIKMEQLTLSGVFGALSEYMGGAYVNDFTEFGRVYQVNLKAEAFARGNIQDVLKLSVRNGNGDMVPFSSFTTIEPILGDQSISRYNMYTSGSMTATIPHGVSSSEAIQAMEEIVSQELGNNYSYAWTGEAYQETQGGTTISFVFILAIVITILVLAAQYESLTDPIAVVISMPTAILGTVIGCLIMGQSIDIYTQIGLILLLGLSAKNAILIVEYAIEYRRTGISIQQAAADAGQVRFRPIMMTALAFVFGIMPMLFATGAGAQSRISLGTAVVFGMFINAVVGTLFVPNFWELLQRFQEKHLMNIFNPDRQAKLQAATAAKAAGSDGSDNSENSESSENSENPENSETGSGAASV